MPVKKSGWALGTLSTGAVSGALIGPLIGGILADLYGLRPVSLLQPRFLFICFIVTLFLLAKILPPVSKKDALSTQQSFSSLKNKKD